MKDRRFKNLSFQCPYCNKTIHYEFYHAGWSDQLFYYCDSCPVVAIIDLYVGKMAKVGILNNDSDIIKMLEHCSCGGYFTENAIPRCPFCRTQIQYKDVVDDLAKIAKNPEYFKSSTIKDGWHTKLHPFYYILEGNKEMNPFKRELGIGEE